ncbi:MAG: hypothetical protein HYU69_07330 [Bacteroidetes bacterium]|nr:hypothetical protein [Bacteroidota bacterium]
MYRLDKNIFKAHTVEEAADHASYYKNISWEKRFEIALYLNSIVFKLVNEPVPKMNKQLFSVRARD